MCGISGIIKWDNTSEVEIQQVKDSLVKMNYRGPDYSSVKVVDNAILGHNRLAILDLNERSNQPMFSEDEKLAIVFNGEIYNYAAIKEELTRKGFTFKSTSDTEVLLKGYQCFGKNILSKLRGMFAFVIWDGINNKVFAARDRFGEKPFYYTLDSVNNFSFASNLSGVLAYLKNKKISKQAVFELFSQQFISEDSCIYEGVKKLSAGHYLEITKENVSLQKYWDANYTEKINISFEDAKKQVHRLLKSSVEEQLEADVPVGLFLSGGTDSSIIAALASKKQKNITALTMSTPGSSAYDESEAAAYVAKYLGINHKIVPLDEKSVNNLPKILKTMEPLADASLIPSMSIAGEAHKDFKVMLSGDGGDEVFGGYKVPLHYLKNEFKGNFLSKEIVNSALQNNNCINQFLRERLDVARLFKWGGIEAYFSSKNTTQSVVLEVLGGGFFENKSFSYYKQAQKATINQEDIFLYAGLKSSLQNDFLLKMDSANMLFSVESRAPFLDYRILDFTSKLNISQLMPNGLDKEMLKSIGANYIPKEFFNLPKKGFSIPYYEYLKGSWGDLLIKLVKQNISSDLGIINASKVEALVKKYKAKPNFKLGKLLYSILVFEIWLRVFHLNQDLKEIEL